MLSTNRKVREGKRNRGSPLPAFIAGATFVVLLRFFVIEPVTVSSTSMYPLLDNGQTAWVFRAAYGLRLPFSTHAVLHWGRARRGDVVLFRRPDTGSMAIKRVLGIADDIVRVVGDTVTVNGEALVSSYSLDHLSSGRIPSGHVFLAGDNRNNSVDSRHYGLLPESRIIGRIIEP